MPSDPPLPTPVVRSPCKANTMGFLFTRTTPGPRSVPPRGTVRRALALAILLAFAPTTFAEAPPPGADVASIHA